MKIKGLHLGGPLERLRLQMESASYAEVLRWGVEHALVQPTSLKEVKHAKRRLAEERIKPELVAATNNQGQFAVIHNTKATIGETLPEGLTCSKVGFLLKVDLVKAKIDEKKMKEEMAQLEKMVVIVYLWVTLDTEDSNVVVGSTRSGSSGRACIGEGAWPGVFPDSV